MHAHVRTVSLLAFAACGGLLACGPKLTMEGARVKVADSSAAATCMLVSDVDADGSSRSAAEVALRNRVGSMNANAVVITETADNGGQVKLVGKAYGCRPDPTAPQ